MRYEEDLKRQGKTGSFKLASKQNQLIILGDEEENDGENLTHVRHN